MNPTFETNQYLIVDQLSYRTHEPHRRDVVIFRFPLNPKDFYIKRVIGLPNETITIQGSDVYIQEAGSETSYKLEEPYIEFTSNNNLEVSLSDEEYFVMGDNRPNSSDSRHWGVLPEKFIVGRAFIRLLPLKNIDFLPGEHEQNFSNETL
jgi:signal peptidase I